MKYIMVVYGDHDPLLEVEFDTLEEAEEAKDAIWVDIIEEEYDE